ncbi:MAG: four helix bundle protein [Microcoleaceae cyanobacterium]
MSSSVYDQAYEYALQIVGLYKYLCNEKKEFTLSQRILNSGTQIGAEIAGAGAAISELESIALHGLAQKYCLETQYWLCLLRDTGYLSPEIFNSLYTEAEDLIQNLSLQTQQVTQSQKPSDWALPKKLVREE